MFVLDFDTLSLQLRGPARVTERAARATEEVAMSKLKVIIAGVLVLGSMATDTAVLAHRTAAAQVDKPPVAEGRAAKPQKQGQEREEGFTVWGKAVGGVQAGLGCHPGQRRAYSLGETVWLVVRVRNVGKDEVKVQYLRQFFIENPPIVTDADGKAVRQLWKLDAGGLGHVPEEVRLAPGQEIELADERYELSPANERGKLFTVKVAPLNGVGKVSFQYGRVFGNSSLGRIQLDPDLSKLATGKLELEINPAQPEKR